MRKHIHCVVLLVLALSLSLASCGLGPSDTPQRVLNVGMLLAQGGLGDRSFNDSAYAGLLAAQQELDMRFETVDFTTDEANLAALREFAQQEYDLIIGVGYECAGYITTLAPEFPERNFALIDTVVDAPNVASVIYREQEGDFIMGALAAMLTQSKKVGFIGGVDIDIIRRIEGGFTQGVAYQDAAVVVISDMAGTFSDAEIGKQLALEQYAQGVDVIYNAAGRTGLGIIEAAKELDQLTIGTSGDQRYLAPGNVVGNRPKRVDTAVLALIREVQAGEFVPGTRSLGLAEEGLTLGPFDETLVTQEMLAQLEVLKEQIIAGEIKVEVSEGN